MKLSPTVTMPSAAFALPCYFLTHFPTTFWQSHRCPVIERYRYYCKWTIILFLVNHHMASQASTGMARQNAVCDHLMVAQPVYKDGLYRDESGEN